MLASLRAQGRSAERVCSLPAAELEAETHFQVFIFKQNVQSTTLIIMNICHCLCKWQFMKIWCSTGSHSHGDAALALLWVSNREFLHWQHWSHNKRAQPKTFSSHSWHSVIISLCFESFFLEAWFSLTLSEKGFIKDNPGYLWQGKSQHNARVSHLPLDSILLESSQ